MNRHTLAVLGATLLLLAGGKVLAKASITLENYEKAREIVAEALADLGGMEALERARGIALRGEGTYDLSARLQGRHPDVDEPVPITEWLVVAADGRVAYESDTRVNSDAVEHLRYTYDGEGRLLFMDLVNRRAFWEAGPGLEQQKQRYVRIIPHEVLNEALHSPSLRYLGWHGEHAVSYTTPTGETLTLIIRRGRLEDVAYLLDMPLLGDTEVRWTFERYVRVPDLGPYPSRVTVYLDERVLKDIRYTDIDTAISDHAIWTAPEDIPVPEAPKRASQVQGKPDMDVREVADGVYMISNLRPGFHDLIVEFDDYLLLVDAPSGWYEMQQLPAMNWVRGESSGSVAQRFLDTVHRRFPDKPVRYVAVTHWHSDHAGGVRPFIAAGATIIATPVTRSVIERAARQSFTLAPDALSDDPVAPEFITVDGELTLNERGRRISFIDVGENPHAAGMLVVWLPQQGVLYQSDLFEPAADRIFPSRERLPVMRWFVKWLDESGLQPASILSIHGNPRVTDAQLAEIRALNEMASSLEAAGGP